MGTHSTLPMSGGYSIGYELTGKKDAPVIILLNGSLFHYGQWDIPVRCGLRPHLRGRFRILRYDYGGTGRSLKSSVIWDLHEVVAELKEMLDRLELEKVHLYGLSKGTIVGQLFTATHPERVASLGGYGWFHFEYSKMEAITSFFRSRLSYFTELGQRAPTPLQKEEFARLWREIYTYVLESFGGERIYHKFSEPFIRKLVFRALEPTPLRVMYDWFSYAVKVMPVAAQEFQGRYSILEKIPMFIQHARGDGTLPYSMAEELHQRVSTSQLQRYEKGYNHVTPTVLPWQAHRVGHDYARWLRSQNP